MKKIGFSRKVLTTMLTLVVAFSLQASVVLAALAPTQGYSQTARLNEKGTTSAYGNVTVLNSPTPTLSMANEGQQYYLNRVNGNADNTADYFNVDPLTGTDVELQVYYGAGMNAYTPTAWKDNAMRYISVVNANSGKAVANWRDETPDANGKNSTGLHQIQFDTDGTNAANQGGILYTIPRAAFDPDQSYLAPFRRQAAAQIIMKAGTTAPKRAIM